MSTLVVDGLRKRYRDHEAVAGISFEVRPGTIFALLGPNGAGKTTTLEILEGFRHRDGGRVEVLGRDPSGRGNRRWLRERVGLVLQDIAVEPYLTVRETITRSAGYYPRPRDVDETIALVGLGGKQNDKVRNLSGGQKRRLDMALGVIGNPELLFLDEPTTGFDPTARRAAWEVVRNLCDTGTTVMLTTHYMEEAQTLADDIVVLAAGKIVAQGTPETIGGRDTAQAQIRFTLPDGVEVADLPIVPSETDQRSVTFEVDDVTAVLHKLTGWALTRDTVLPGLAVHRPSLEDVYLSLTGDDAGRPDPEARSRSRRRKDRRTA
ncbi:ABC transporter ATP-binding protein [Dactylosporangium sp. NPDC051484]|uniref:ABC transporter ATP-binding protein n=1 Tax=Dactylosporangium sp. NPDC051484 TaxID=3154942 RepID=UPI0034503551